MQEEFLSKGKSPSAAFGHSLLVDLSAIRGNTIASRSIAVRMTKPFLLTILALSLGCGASGQLQSQSGVSAPSIVGDIWWNSPKPLRLGGGKVTILHFWTFGCINCQRNQPIYKRWVSKYKETDVQVLGIHTPETEAEKVPANVEEYLKKQGLEYPSVFDAKAENWKKWNNRYWPSVFLVDKKGRVRYLWEGELNYRGATGDKQIEAKIRELLAEKD